MNSLISNFKSHFFNLKGWRTNRKLVVIESDDWGMQRIPSKQVFDKLTANGIPLEESVYNRFDSLESDDDLVALMETLQSVKDKNNNHAIFTLNNIVANPDFLKIKASNFEEYYYEDFTITLSNNKKSEGVMSLYSEGLRNKLFKMQFHGREHVHINNWMSKLRSGDKNYRIAFDQGVFSVNDLRGSSCRLECLDAMAIYNASDQLIVLQAVKEGLEIFEKVWNYKSETAIAPCYTWSKPVENTFKKNGIKYVQGSRAQRIAVNLNKPYEIKRHFTGEHNNELYYMVRNIDFEQIERKSEDIISRALKEMEIAFLWKKPAIISSHRLNYIGTLDEKSRERNLKMLKELLMKIVNKFPDVEFISSDELGSIMESETKQVCAG